MKTSSLLLLTCIAGACACVTASAEKQAYNFKDPKNVNNVSFRLDAPLESITGTGDGISGTVHFDPKKPETISGEIVLDATTVTVPNPLMQDHLHGEKWLHSEQFGTITFATKDVKNLKKTERGYTADITGHLTLKGTTKEINVPVQITFLPDKLGARSNGKMQGDLLVLRSDFTINRSDYGIMPGQATDKVAEEVEISLALAGYHERS